MIRQFETKILVFDKEKSVARWRRRFKVLNNTLLDQPTNLVLSDYYFYWEIHG